MRARILAAAGGLLLAGCAASPERPDGGALVAIGTPVFAVVKAVGCVATVVVAAPAAAAVAMTDRPDRAALTGELERGVAHNCGGRWTLGAS